MISTSGVASVKDRGLRRYYTRKHKRYTQWLKTVFGYHLWWCSKRDKYLKKAKPDILKIENRIVKEEINEIVYGVNSSNEGI